ncbi:MAG: nucleotidyltransferase family protein [Acetobacteraceae bacterium]
MRLVVAAGYADGLAASLKAGIGAVPEACGAAIVCLDDIPLVSAEIIDRLLAAYRPGTGRGIVVPTAHGKQGNPVLWDRGYFPEILTLSGDTGARRLFARHEEEIVEVGVGDDAVLRDIDTPEALAALPERF